MTTARRAKRPSSTVHTVPLLPSKPVTAASGTSVAFSSVGDLDQHLGLLAQMEADRAHVTFDVDTPLLA